MQNLIQRLIPAYARWIIRWRWPVLIASLLAAVTAASGVRYLETTADIRVYFGPENPQLLAYDALEDTYTKTDNILFVLQPKDKNVFTRETLTAITIPMWITSINNLMTW